MEIEYDIIGQLKCFFQKDETSLMKKCLVSLQENFQIENRKTRRKLLFYNYSRFEIFLYDIALEKSRFAEAYHVKGFSHFRNESN